MHIAASLGRPIVTIRGLTDPIRCKLLKVEHIFIQNDGRKAEYIDAEFVFLAIEKSFPSLNNLLNLNRIEFKSFNLLE